MRKFLFIPKTVWKLHDLVLIKILVLNSKKLKCYLTSSLLPKFSLIKKFNNGCNKRYSDGARSGVYVDAPYFPIKLQQFRTSSLLCDCQFWHILFDCFFWYKVHF